MGKQTANDYIQQRFVGRGKRPRFHVSPPVGWLNDPNGFSVYKDDIHLFYQYHPYATRWGPMHWGHVKSKDMICWEELPVAIAPDQTYDKDGCFSGSAIEVDGQHGLVYTGVTSCRENGAEVQRQSQCLAIGDGLTYEKYGHNPVLSFEALPDGFSMEHFRDPKIWKDGERYFLVAGNLNQENQGQVVLFEGDSLTNWHYRGVLAADTENEYGKMWECPDFFPLGDQHVLICSPQFMRAKDLEFHNGHNSIYFAGFYQDGHFEKGNARSLDYGLDFYAPQTTELADGRRILIGWLKSWDSVSTVEGLEWQGMMTLPRELSFRGKQLIQQPIRELSNYHSNPVQQSFQLSGESLLVDFSGRCLDLTLELSGEAYETFQIDLACNEEYRTSFYYHRSEQLISVDRTYSGLTLDQNCQRSMRIAFYPQTKLQFIMDTHSIELFVNDGEQVFSLEIETPLEADQIRLTSDGRTDISLTKYDIEIPF